MFDESVQAYICGYAAHSIKKKFKCSDCKSLAVKSVGNQTEDTYFDFLQRGGLCISTEEVKYVYYHLCAIFEYIINRKEIEAKFLNNKNHKNLLSLLALASLESDNFPLDFESVCHCGATVRKIFSNVSLIISNIVLNNYTKNKNDLTHASKNEKKRKLTTLV